MHSHVKSVRTIDDLTGPAGRLEALLNTGSAEATHAVLLCHPHPLGGGTMHNKVVYHTTKALQSLGLPVLRFNFRGTGLSDGDHDGHAEQDDSTNPLLTQQHDNGKDKHNQGKHGKGKDKIKTHP